jgi:hypothetical protein
MTKSSYLDRAPGATDAGVFGGRDCRQSTALVYWMRSEGERSALLPLEGSHP